MIVRRATAFHTPKVPGVEPFAPFVLLVPLPPAAPPPPTAEIIPFQPRQIGSISLAVAKEFDLSVGTLTSQSRHRDVAWARQFGMYLAHRVTKRSLKVIGRAFGRNDHTTVLHGIRAAEQRLGVPSAWCRAHESVCLALLDEETETAAESRSELMAHELPLNEVAA